MNILFRGLRADGKCWVEGDRCRFAGRHYIIPENQQFRDIEDADFDSSFIEVTPETVGQYTGLIDKNGKKIFVGDKLRPFSPNYQYEVVFQNGEFGVSNNIGYWGSLSKYRETYEKFNYHFEIIGNVHENQ